MKKPLQKRFHLAIPPDLDERALEETLTGGQAFRWYRDPSGDSWTGIWLDHAVRLKLAGPRGLAVEPLSPTAPAIVEAYLGFDRLPALKAVLPLEADPVLKERERQWGGLSLLRQPAGETLLAFICSSNKQILQIRAMLHQLARAYGRPVPGTPFHRLPDWTELAGVSEAGLRACGLGYRAAHIAGTAAFLQRHGGFLESVAAMEPGAARGALQQLPGVGPKVAECVRLFGLGHCDAFPVDTWIARRMAIHYPDLEGWPRDRIATFARLHYGRAAGLAQQWLFAERSKPPPSACQWDRLAGDPASTNHPGPQA